MGTTYTLSGNLATVFGGAPSQIHAAYLRTNLPPGKALVDTTAESGSIRLGHGSIKFDRATGLFSVQLLGTANTGLNVAQNTLRYQVVVEYARVGQHGLETWESGFFALTEDTDLRLVVPDVELVMATTIAEQLAARIDGYVDHGDLSGAVTFSGPTGSHWFEATAPTTVTLDDFEEGQVVTLICFSGAEDVTVVDAGDVELVDATAWSAQLARGVWIGGGGGGAPAVPDTTPPTAITDLTATGGAGELEIDCTLPTDAESTPHIRYRYWLTAGTEPSTWETTDTMPVAVTGLPAGAYSVKAYSYSAGGPTEPDTATTTVTGVPGWNTVLTDAFTASNGTLVGHVPNVSPDGDAWSLGPSWSPGSGDPAHIIGNKAGQDAGTTSPVGCNVQIPTGTRSGIGISVDYNLASQLDSSTPRLTIGFGPSVKLDLAGGVVISADNPSVGGMTLTGTTSGHPASGTLSFRCVGTALSISINGTEVCTATMAANWNAATDVTLYLTNFKQSTVDNVQVEVLT